MAMVILVIGLLTVGANYGNKLYESYRINSMISNMTEYKGAYEMFVSKYSYPPGDLPTASVFWSNCAETNTNCNGNGNGKIERGNNATTDEVVAAMHHLKLDGLIKFNGGQLKNAFDGSVKPGVNVPKTGLNESGFYLSAGKDLLDKNTTILAPFETNVNALYAGLSATSNNPVAGGIRPEIAKIIDSKIDDGKPLSGKIRAVSGSNYNRANCLNGYDYNASSADESCLFAYGINYVKDSMDELYVSKLLQFTLSNMNVNAVLAQTSNGNGNGSGSHNNGGGNPNTCTGVNVLNIFTGLCENPNDSIDVVVTAPPVDTTIHGVLGEPEGLGVPEPPPPTCAWYCFWFWCVYVCW